LEQLCCECYGLVKTETDRVLPLHPLRTVANRIHERLTDFGPEACGSSMTVALAASP
jgi:hypothetical protein